MNNKEKITLGQYPLISLKSARELRDSARLSKSFGKDPNNRNNYLPQTFGELYEDFHKTQEQSIERGQLSSVYVRSFDERVKNHILPHHKDTLVKDITSYEILLIIRAIDMTGKHEQARRIKQFYGQLFRHGIILGCCETDPTYPLRGVLGKTETHYATITEPREVGGLMCAIYSYGPFVMRRALQLHMYTFVCPGELRYAGWSEIDWDRAVWKIPAEKMKMKRIHWVPLSRQSVEVLRAIGKYTGGGRYIFHSTRVRDGSRPMSKAGELATLRRIGYTTEGICPHGFRGMASTLLHENGWPSDYIEKQLTHEVGNTVAQAYNHAQHLEKRTEMMQWWADYLDKLRDTA